MGTREVDPRLQKLWDDKIKTYSISKLNTMEQCPYQAWLNYHEHIKQLNVGIYGILGGRCHDCIEDCILGKAVPEDIKQAIQDELADMELLGVHFPLDRKGGTSIRDNWVANMTRFAEEFTTPKGKFITEELLLFPIDDEHYMMGYADAIRFITDKKVWLIDWKTSSNFDKTHLLSAGRQLIVYKKALEKLGYEVVKCSWCMLKYCETSWTLKNGKTKTKVSEWRNLIKDMRSYIEKALSDLGYDDLDIECCMKEGLESNSWDVFPKEIQEKFTTKIYVRDYDITPELEDECMEYIHNMINLYETLGDDESAYKSCDINKNSYFCNALCGYGGKSGQCKYYVDYLDQFEKKDSEKSEFDELFS